MMIKIDSDEVELLTKHLDEYSLDLFAEIKGCIEDLNSLKSNYISPEGTYVIQTCEAYFDNLKVLPYNLNEINDAIRKANNMYTEQDNDFLKEIQKEEEEYRDEQDIYRH